MAHTPNASSAVILALDYGTRYIGLAVSDPDQRIALSMQPIRVGNRNTPLKALHKWLKDQPFQIIEFLIGMPTGYADQPTAMTRTVQAFAEELTQQTRIPHRLWNEVHTSELAAKNVGTSTAIHSEAARILLQEYLDFLHQGY